jgi:putative drug exporter of the RND superfamily
MFYALGKLIHRRRWPTLFGSLLFLALACVAWAIGGRLTSARLEGLEAQKADDKIAEVVGRSTENTFVVLFESETLKAGTPAFAQAADAALAPLRRDVRVARVEGLGELPPQVLAQRQSVEGNVAFALVTLEGENKNALANYPGIRNALYSDQLRIRATGRVPFNHDMNRTLEHDLVLAELISIPLALLVLLLVFRTAVAAALPVGVGGLAVVGGIGIILVASHRADISQYAINICSLIGLGVAIDYSLFTVARYREELAAGYSYPEALARTVDHSGRVVAFSALAVAVGLTGLMFFKGSYLMAMGVAGAIVVGLAGIFALTFLPALLAVLGKRIHALKLPLPKFVQKSRVGPWRRIAGWVMERPVLVLLPTLAVLVVLGSPAVGMRLASSDVTVLPAETDAHQGWVLLEKWFPDEADTHVNVAVEFPDENLWTPERVGALYDLSARVAALPNVRTVRSLTWGNPRLSGREQVVGMLTHPPAVAKGQVDAAKAAMSKGRVVFLQAITAATPESEAARDIVRAVRAQRQVGDGTLWVGGESALDLDTSQFMLSRAPWAVGFVVLATFVVLFLVLGSVLLPIKAVLMNFLSLTGSFGALVWLFQEGHLVSGPARPLEPALPVLLFCVLFGLSMDYEVLILSRMKEAYDRTGDNRTAVGEGLEKTGGLVTSAAAIMVAVFMAFGLSRLVLVQAVGVGMALAVALDATLVRVLLVPATMRLFGDANWWAPKWLHTLRQWLGLEESEKTPRQRPPRLGVTRFGH